MLRPRAGRQPSRRKHRWFQRTHRRRARERLLELGDEVEFEAVHFGIRQRLRSKIVEFDRPRIFVDEMQRGAFKRLRHTHEFARTERGTLMIDELDFASPFGLLGAIADKLFLAGYMRRFMLAKNAELKRLIESELR